MDILTDILIITVPIALVYPVKLPLQRKLAIVSMLSLSVFMIVITVIRVTGASLPTEFGTLDASWVCFWQAMEAVVAIVMVSALALKSMFGLESQKKTLHRRETVNEGSRSVPHTVLRSISHRLLTRWSSWARKRSSPRRCDLDDLERQKLEVCETEKVHENPANTQSLGMKLPVRVVLAPVQVERSRAELRLEHRTAAPNLNKPLPRSPTVAPTF